MNIAVLYRSMTGHSKKIANAIAKELNLTALNIKKTTKPEDVDIAFIVGGIYSGNSLPDMSAFLRTLTIDNIKKVVLITSSVADKKGQDEARRILTENNIEVATEEYRCKGNFLFLKMGHPNKSEVQGAVDFAKKFIEKPL